MTLSRRYVAAAALALAIGIAASIGYRTFGAGTPAVAPSIGYVALDGRTTSFDALRGKVVLVSFWATTCAVCVREMPNVVATHEMFRGRGYETVAVAMSYDPPARVADFAERRQLPFDVAIDNTGAIAKAFGDVRATPTAFLLNRRGEVVKRFVGEPDFTAFQQLVEQLLAEG